MNRHPEATATGTHRCAACHATKTGAFAAVNASVGGTAGTRRRPTQYVCNACLLAEAERAAEHNRRSQQELADAIAALEGEDELERSRR